METLLAFVLGIIAAVLVVNIRTIIPLEEEIRMLDDELKGLKGRQRLFHKED